MFNEYIKPLIVLTSICLVLSAALALVNDATAPVIAAAADERALEAMREIIPEATDFEGIDLSELNNIPKTVREAYRTTNDVGYIFIAAGVGYSGEITIICAVAGSGEIIAVSTLSHTETVGIGTVVEDEAFLSQFVGKSSGLDGVDTVTGATISTRAFIATVRDVFEVLKQIR